MWSSITRKEEPGESIESLMTSLRRLKMHCSYGGMKEGLICNCLAIELQEHLVPEKPQSDPNLILEPACTQAWHMEAVHKPHAVIRVKLQAEDSGQVKGKAHSGRKTFHKAPENAQPYWKHAKDTAKMLKKNKSVWQLDQCATTVTKKVTGYKFPLFKQRNGGKNTLKAVMPDDTDEGHSWMIGSTQSTRWNQMENRTVSQWKDSCVLSKLRCWRECNASKRNTRSSDPWANISKALWCEWTATWGIGKVGSNRTTQEEIPATKGLHGQWPGTAPARKKCQQSAGVHTTSVYIVWSCSQGILWKVPWAVQGRHYG